MTENTGRNYRPDKSAYAQVIKRYEETAKRDVPLGYSIVTGGVTQAGDLYFNHNSGRFEKIENHPNDIGTRVKGFIMVVRKGV